MFSFIRTRLIARILCVMTLVILSITAGNAAIQWMNTGSAVKGTISSYNMSIASHYVTQIDAGRYSGFLADPQESDLYWSLRHELDQFRKSIGARYVYFVRIDEANQPQLMIDGRPEGDPLASGINEATDMPAAAVQSVLAGENASTPLIHSPEYGDYISAFVPMKDAGGRLVGALGIDTDVAVLSTLTRDVLIQSLPLYSIILALSLAALWCWPGSSPGPCVRWRPLRRVRAPWRKGIWPGQPALCMPVRSPPGMRLAGRIRRCSRCREI